MKWKLYIINIIFCKHSGEFFPVIFEISPLHVIVLTLSFCVCVCVVCVCVCVCVHVLTFVLTVWVLCFVMGYVLQFGEIAHRRVHY